MKVETSVKMFLLYQSIKPEMLDAAMKQLDVRVPRRNTLLRAGIQVRSNYRV
jgi:hypothetical protein